jgi:hypothetical protein
MIRGGLVGCVRFAWLCSALSALAFGGCASSDKDGAGGTGAGNESWTCFKKSDAEEPCQCQTTPVGGKQEIIDRCGPELVQESDSAADAECCKLWLWLNGKRVSSFYCSCYLADSKSCNVASGDEIVDSCP